MDNFKSFLFFITAALLVYGGINYYIYRRIMSAAALTGAGYWTLRLVLYLLIISFPLGHFWSGRLLGVVFEWMGAIWLGIMVYAVLACLLIDFIKIGDLLTGWLPDWAAVDRKLTGRLVLAVVATFIAILLVSGYIRSLYPIVREVETSTPKISENSNPYRIVAFSDIHLGALMGEKRLRRLVNQVNDLSPHLILIVGDLMDERAEKLEWVKTQLNRLQAEDGVYAVTGNHEFYAGISNFESLLSGTNIKLLRNKAEKVKDAVVLIGLDDATGSRQYRDSYVKITDLTEDLTPDLFWIVLHHSPTRIKEAQSAGADLMISGHSHGGQLWPFGYITRAVFGVRQGLTKFGRMTFYLMNGAGTWGPPARIGASSDIFALTLNRTSN